jgi:hypothetical protein
VVLLGALRSWQFVVVDHGAMIVWSSVGVWLAGNVLIEFNSTEGELAESSALLELGGPLGILLNPKQSVSHVPITASLHPPQPGHVSNAKDMTVAVQSRQRGSDIHVRIRQPWSRCVRFDFACRRSREAKMEGTVMRRRRVWGVSLGMRANVEPKKSATR